MSKLALLGGNKTVTANTNVQLPLVGEKAIEKVVELCKKNQVSTSPLVYEFEDTWKKYVGAKYAVSTNCGTSALHEAIFAVGVGPGDEVLVPSYTWIFTAAPITALHGVPVFCEVDIDTHTLDPNDLENKITSRTKAILPVHAWGNPTNMDAIMAIAKKHNLKVIEDCAHAVGPDWKGKKVGVVGDVGCYSFQGSKPLIAGEGGMLVTNDREIYERACTLAHYERVFQLPDDSPYKPYTTSMGFKHRVHPLGMAIASQEFGFLEERNAVRKANGLYFDKGISDIKGLKPVQTYEGASREYSYHYGRYDEEYMDGIATITFLQALKSEGISVGVCGYGFLHQAPFFLTKDFYSNSYPDKNPPMNEPVSLPKTEYLRNRSFLMAPRFEIECKDLLDQYIEAYHKVAANVGELHDYETKHGIKQTDVAASGRSINLL